MYGEGGNRLDGWLRSRSSCTASYIHMNKMHQIGSLHEEWMDNDGQGARLNHRTMARGEEGEALPLLKVRAQYISCGVWRCLGAFRYVSSQCHTATNVLRSYLKESSPSSIIIQREAKSFTY